MARKEPDIYIGSTVKKRDRLSYKNFVIDIIEDTFLNEFTPTSQSLNGELFTVILGPVDYTVPVDGDFIDEQFITGSQVDGQPRNDIKGYRFVYENLPVDSAKDYVDIYLFGVKQPQDRYTIELYNYPSGNLNDPQPVSPTAEGMQEIRFVFSEAITRVPQDVVITHWDIKGKIKEIR